MKSKAGQLLPVVGLGHPISLQIKKANQKIQNKINGYRDKKPARSQSNISPNFSTFQNLVGFWQAFGRALSEFELVDHLTQGVGG